MDALSLRTLELDGALGLDLIDDQPWGFAPSHYGRWALIDEHWAWVLAPRRAPLYVPAVVAFIGTPGVGLSSRRGGGRLVPARTGRGLLAELHANVNYVRSLNLGMSDARRSDAGRRRAAS
jgi:hypothetical protein